MKFKKAALLELLWNKEVGPIVHDEDTGEEVNTPRLLKVKEQITGQRRWETDSELIFKNLDTGKFYRTHYSVGSTEYQDTFPFQFEGDEIECQEMVAKTVETVVYEPAGEGS